MSAETRAWGFSYGDIQQMKRERDIYLHALDTIISGKLNRKAPRDIRGARRIAFDALRAGHTTDTKPSESRLDKR